MHKCLIAILFLVFLTGAALAQTSRKDSLLKLLPQQKEDTVKTTMLVTLANDLENSEPLLARSYYLQALTLSERLHYDLDFHRALVGLGSTYLARGEYDSALIYQEQALANARKLKDTFNIGISLFNIGINYRERSMFEKAIEYCLEGRRMMGGRGQAHIEIQLDDALQILYFNRSEYQKAIPYGESAVALSRKMNYKEFLANNLVNLSLSYIESKQLDKANTALQEALGIARKLDLKRTVGVALQNLAAIALKHKDYNTARQYSLQSLELYKQVGSTDGIATVLRALAVFDLQQGHNASAKAYAEQALALNRQNGYKKEEVSILRVLAVIAYASNERDKGMDYDDASQQMLEEMVKDVTSQQSSDLEKKYETEKKEIRIKQLEADKKLQALSLHQKNIINYVLIGGAFILIVIAALFYRDYRQKQALQQQRIAELEKEKQLMATEAVLKGEEQERTRLAKDLHDGLGGMLSGIKHAFTNMKGNLIMTPDNQQAFERSMDMLDSSIKEMRRVAHNMMPEALVKFGLDTALRDFCSDINQSGVLRVTYQSIGLEDAVIEQTTAITIYRIVQELIHNTVKHAMANSAIVQVIRSDNQLAVTVEDDGRGFDTAILKASKGIGWTNIQSRVDFLKGKMDVQSRPGKGTSVHIELDQA